LCREGIPGERSEHASCVPGFSRFPRPSRLANLLDRRPQWRGDLKIWTPRLIQWLLEAQEPDGIPVENVALLLRREELG
jgi:hypothetical protein